MNRKHPISSPVRVSSPARGLEPHAVARKHGSTRHALAAIACLLASSACSDPIDPDLSGAFQDAGEDEPDAKTDESTDPGEARGGGAGKDAGGDESDEPEDDPGTMLPFDAGAEVDAGPVINVSEAGIPVVVSPPMEVKEALCTDAYDSVQLSYTNVTRGSWQLNPGETFMKLAAPSYPCTAFLQEKKTRPADNDMKWTDAPDGAFVGFSEPSSISTTDYAQAQFRYFRSFIFVPKGANLKSLTVHATGIDDSVYLELTNTRYPKGTSPLDVGPSDPAVGACQGNGMGEWNLAKYMAEGEINVLLLVHADLAAATSTLASVDVRADGAPIQLVSCKK